MNTSDKAALIAKYIETKRDAEKGFYIEDAKVAYDAIRVAGIHDDAVFVDGMIGEDTVPTWKNVYDLLEAYE